MLHPHVNQHIHTKIVIKFQGFRVYRGQKNRFLIDFAGHRYNSVYYCCIKTLIALTRISVCCAALFANGSCGVEAFTRSRQACPSTPLTANASAAEICKWVRLFSDVFGVCKTSRRLAWVRDRFIADSENNNLSFGARAFRVAAPKIWNSIPLHIRQSQTYSSFRRHLKTYYFLSAHHAPPAAPVMRPDSLPRLWRYINLLLTYLLT